VADHTIFVFEISADFVFDLDLVVFTQGRKTGDPLGHPHEPLVQIEIVRTLI